MFSTSDLFHKCPLQQRSWPGIKMPLSSPASVHQCPGQRSFTGSGRKNWTSVKANWGWLQDALRCFSDDYYRKQTLTLCIKWWFLLHTSFCGCTRAYSYSSMTLFSFFTCNFKAVFWFEASGIVSWKCRNPCQNQPTKNKAVIKINFHSSHISKYSAEPRAAWQHCNSMSKAL